MDITYHDSENDDGEQFQLPRASLEWTGERCAFIERSDDIRQDLPQAKSFGEWLLTNVPAKSITVVATTDVECWYISRRAFEAAVGPLSLILKEDAK